MKEVSLILGELRKVLGNVSEKNTLRFVNEIIKAREVNLIGHGRSWHVAKCFSMRLKHLGLDVGRLGKMPGRNTNSDLNIVISGSGETKDILEIVKKIKKGKIVLLTFSPRSSIAKKADVVIKLDAGESKQPLRSLFEQSVLVYLDSVVILLMKKLGADESSMWKRHK